MKEVSRGWGVSFERFLQMIEDLGHAQQQYQAEDGFVRTMLEGLRVKRLGE